MRELATDAITTEDKREMMAITTKSSIKVNPLFLKQLIFPVYQRDFFSQGKKKKIIKTLLNYPRLFCMDFKVLVYNI